MRNSITFKFIKEDANPLELKVLEAAFSKDKILKIENLTYKVVRFESTLVDRCDNFNIRYSLRPTFKHEVSIELEHVVGTCEVSA